MRTHKVTGMAVGYHPHEERVMVDLTSNTSNDMMLMDLNRLADLVAMVEANHAVSWRSAQRNAAAFGVWK